MAPSVVALNLTAEVALAVVGPKVGAYDAVRVEGQEGAAPSVKPGDDAVASHCLQDIAADRRVAQRLRLAQIILPADVAEFAAMLAVVLIQPVAVGKADRGAPGLGLRPARLRRRRPRLDLRGAAIAGRRRRTEQARPATERCALVYPV
jgi:hypothetical protein